MKILLLGFVRVAHMPYMYNYARLLGDEHELHLISWNRNGTPDAPLPDGIARHFEFEGRVEDADSLQRKIPHFARFRRFALQVMSSQRYDSIVVLHSTPGITVLDRLERDYKGRYILDYLDVSHEGIAPYRGLIRRLSRSAGLVLASSPAYLQYLECSGGVAIKHNLLESTRLPRVEPMVGAPIRVRYWGMIRHEAANIALVDALGNDRRFELHYHGREEEVADRLKARVSECGYDNVFFHGAYYAPERAEFAAASDLIHNVYENDSVTIGAMGNKYYDGIQFGVPQLCTAGSIMGNEVSTRGLGLAVDYSSPHLADEIADYYASFDRARFQASCASALAEVKGENDIANVAIVNFFKDDLK